MVATTKGEWIYLDKIKPQNDLIVSKYADHGKMT